VDQPSRLLGRRLQRRAALQIGSWWPERALMLAKYQNTWIRPPQGTRFGLFNRYSIREVAGDGYR